MLLSKVKTIFEAKLSSSGGLKMPEDGVLDSLCHESLRYVATKCIPAELLRDSVTDTDDTVFRHLTDGSYIAEPEFPDFTSTSKHLMIDEELVYAVINKMVALYSREVQYIVKYENEASTLINSYKAHFLKVAQK